MAFELDFPDEAADEKRPTRAPSSSLTLDWPDEVLTPKPESAAWTLFEAAKMTAKAPGKAIADVILPPDPTVKALGERVVEGAMAAVSPPATMEADLKAIAPKPPVDKVSGFKLSTDVVDRPTEAQGPEAILKGAQTLAKETKPQSSVVQRMLHIDPAESERRAAASIADHQAYVDALAARTGESKETISRLVAPMSSQIPVMGYLDGFGMGLPLALADAFGIQVEAKPKDRSVFDTWTDEMNRVTFGVGKLAGEVTGLPFKVAGMAVEEVFGRWLLPTSVDGASTMVAKFLAKEAATVAVGSSYSKTGEAISQPSADASLKIMGKAASDGALFGLIFGGVKGVLPAEDLASKAARIGLGTALIDLVEGKNIVDNRSFLEKAHDYAMNAVFLFHGYDAAEVSKKLKDDAKAKGITIDDEFRISVAESKAKVNDAVWNRPVEIFKRQFIEQGFTEADANIAAQRAAARHIAENVGISSRPPEEPGSPAVTAEPREGTLPAKAGEFTLDFPASRPSEAATGASALDFPSETTSPDAAAGTGQDIAPDPVRQAIEAAGGVYAGRTAEGVWFSDPATGSTTLLPADMVTPEAIKAEIAAIRKPFGVPEPPVPAEAPAASPAVGGTGPEAPAPRPPESPTVAKPEPVFKQTLYRGSGASLEKVYGADKVAAGTAVPIMGKAKYYAMTEEDARFYGDEIAKEEVGLHKPLVLDNDQDWRKLLRDAGVEGLHSTSREAYDSPELVPSWTQALQKYIRAQGYDGVVVKLTSRAESDQTRRMNETFGHSQVIKFETKAEAVARAMARSAAKGQAPAPVTAKVTAPTSPAGPVIAETIKAKAFGAAGEAVTDAGTTVPFQWAVVDAGDLRTSKDPGFPQEFQPRAVGTRAQYEAQEHTIAGGLDPQQLGENRLASQGAPMVDMRGNVISGNRRSEALRKIYGPDPRYDAQRAAYVAWLEANHERLGITTADFNKATLPVLVRMITDPAMDLKKLAQEANVSSVSMMSAQELAGIDAGNLTSKTMTLFQPSETGQINTVQNRDFIRAFIAEVIPAPERGRYLTPEGGLNQDGLARIRNALFARAYPGGDKLVGILAESLDNNIRNVTVALQNVAPKVIDVEGRIADRHPDLLISRDIAQAAEKLSALRASGVPDAVKDYLNQPALIADETITPLGQSILALFDTQAKSAKRIQEVLGNYLTLLDSAIGHPDQISMLPPTDLTADNFWEAAVRKAERDAPEQGSLYPTKPFGGESHTGAAGAAVPERRPRTTVTKPPVAAAAESGRGPAAPPPVPEGGTGSGEGAVRSEGEAPPEGTGVRGITADVARKFIVFPGASAAKARIHARLKKPTDEMSTGGAEEDALLDDLIEYGGSVYEGGVRDLATWSAQMRRDLGPDIEEYLEPAFAGIQARMEANRGETAPRPVQAEPAAGPAGRVEGGGAPEGPRPRGAGVERVERPGDERTRRIITARADRTHDASVSDIPQRLAAHLDDDQKQGVAKAVASLDARNSFLNADMTGVGKTRQELAIASMMAERGHPVLIVSPAEVLKMRSIKDQWVISGSFLDDSKTMGISITPWVAGDLENGRIYVTPYSRFHRVKVPPNMIAIFDESHRLKNARSGTSKIGLRMIGEAAGSAFFSATPADMAQHVHYLVHAGVFGNKTVEEVYKELGLIQRTQKVIGAGSVMIWEVNPNLKTSQVLERMEAAFGNLTEQGAMVKREIAMDGVQVNFVTVPVSQEAHMIQQKIESGYKRNFGDNLNGLRKAQMYLAKRRQLEPYKVDQTVSAVKKSLDEGRPSIVFISRINFSEVAVKQKIRNRYGEVVSEVKDVIHEGSEGTVKLVRSALEKIGIKDIAELHGESPTTGVKAMEDFQAGRARVLLATIESGGTGINLDDRVGNAPRDMVIVTSPFSAVETIQAVGRIWRKTTKSYPRVTFLFADEDIDVWNAGIAARKMKMLGAIVSGDVPKLDVSVQGLSEGDFTGSDEMAPEEQMVLPGDEAVQPTEEGMATVGTQATTPPKPGTLGGLFRGRQSTTGEPRKDQLIQSLAKAVRMAKAGALIVQGSVRGKGLMGWRHRVSGNIHLRHGTDVDTAAHEVGHALQRDGLTVTDRELMPFTQEMKALTQVLGVGGPTRSEGFAEFSRLYMTDPALARQVAPTFYPWFEARLSTVPTLEAAVHEFRDQVLRMRAKNPIERMRAGIAFPRDGRAEAGPPKTPGEKLHAAIRGIVASYWNRAMPLREISDALDPRGDVLAASKDPHKLYKTLGARIASVGGHFIQDGIVDAETGRVIPGTRGFHDIVKSVAEHQEDYSIYELGKKMQEMETSDIPEHRRAAENLRSFFGVTPADLAWNSRELERRYPHFRQVLDDLQPFNDGVLQYLVDTGNYSQKAIETIKGSRDTYVPLGRLMESGPGGSSGDAFSGGRPLHKIRGTSQRIVLPTLVERARQIYTFVAAAERNLVASKLADALESDLARGKNLGVYMEKVNTPVSVTTAQIATFRDTIQSAFIKAGGDPAVFDHVDWSTLVQIFQPDLSDLERNQMVIWRKGVPEVWEVHDQALMLALKQMDRSMVQPWVEAMGWGASALYKLATVPVRMLHGGVVHAPDFLVAHLTRQVQEESAQGFFMPRFIAGTVGKNLAEITRRWRVGGGQVFHYISLDSQSIQRNLDDLRFGHWYEGGVKRSARELMSKFDDVTRWFDQAGRIGVARSVIEHPRAVDVAEGEMSVNIDAAFRAREAGGDYEQAGNSVFWRFFSSMIPFTRAAQVHIYRTNRNFREAFEAAGRRDFNNPKLKGMLVTGGAMMLLEMLSYLYLADDVRWKQTQEWEKTLYYHVLWPWQGRVTQAEWNAMTDVQKKAVGPLTKIPKSFFLSWVFSTMPRQVSEYAHDHDPGAFDRIVKNLSESLLQSNHVSLIPGLVKPALDIARNKNPLSGAPLNPRRLEGFPPEHQKQFYTPEVAARASEIMQKIPVLKDLHLTPIDVDHLVRGYTGYAGQYSEAVLDSLGRAIAGGTTPVQPSTRLSEQMGLRRFVSRFPNARTQQLDEFYSAYHESQQTWNAIRQMTKEGKTSAEVEAFKKSNGFDPEMTGRLMATAKVFNGYRQSLDRVMKGTLDADQKRAAIDKILLQELDTATSTMEWVKAKRRTAAEVAP